MIKKYIVGIGLLVLVALDGKGQTIDSGGYLIIDRFSVTDSTFLATPPFIVMWQNKDTPIEVHGDTMACIRMLFRELKKTTDDLRFAEEILRYVTLNGTVPNHRKNQFDEAVSEYLKNKKINQ